MKYLTEEEEKKVLKTRKRLRIFFFILIITLSTILAMLTECEIYEKIAMVVVFSGIWLIAIEILLRFITKVPKVLYICSKCGLRISDKSNQCRVKVVKYYGTVDRTEFVTTTGTSTSSTEHLRGGYAQRNGAVPNRTSETTTTTKTKIPIVKRYHKYEIEYVCEKCNNHITKADIETLKLIK